MDGSQSKDDDASASEDREFAGLSAALAVAPIATLILDDQGVVRWANEEAGVFGRRPASELVGLSFGDATACTRALSGCTTLPECAGCTLAQLIRSGLDSGATARMVELEAPFVRPEVLDPPRVVASISSYTFERSRRLILSLQILAASQRPDAVSSTDLVTVTNALAEALFTVRLPERKIEYVNRAAEELFGYEAAQMIGQPTSVLYPSQAEAEAFGRKLAAALAAGAPQLRTEHRFARSDGEPFWGAVSTTFLFEGGRPTRVISVLFDVSERKRMEQELRASEHRYRAIFDRAPVGISLFDASSSRYLAVNDRYCEIVGRSREDMLKQSFAAITHPDDRAVETAALAALRRGKRDAIELEKRLLRADGELVHVRKLLVPIGEQGRFELGLAIIEDITEKLHHAEEKARIAESLRERQKLDSLGLLAGGIAHDFNNLIAGVSINTELLRDAIAPDSPDQRRLDAIEQSVARASELTRQLLAYAGKGRLVVERVDLGEVVASMSELLRLSVSKKTTLEFDLEPVAALEADTTQLRQVIMNLVINASEAQPQGRGRVRVTTRDETRTQLDELAVFPSRSLPPGRYARLEVSDEGCGITPELLPKLFDPFFTTKERGHGLGLSAILGIANSHHGGIQVKSAPGAGTTFRVLLPIVGGELSPRVEPPPSVDDWRGAGRVLLVDDDATLRTATREMLERLGFAVEEAEDGARALELVGGAAEPFTCVLMDLTMPLMDGHETLVRLRAIDEGVPVILSSGFSTQELSESFDVQGFAAFLAKPYDRQDLVRILRVVLDAH